MAKHIENLINEAIKFYQQKDLIQVTKVLNTLLNVDPNNPFGLFFSGVILTKKKKYLEAISYYDRAIYFKNDYYECWFNKGFSFLKLKRLQESLHSFDQAIKLKPDFVAAWLNKGNVLFELRRFDEAIVHLNKAIELKPDFAIAWCNKGNAYKEKGEIEKSLVCYDKAINLKPDYVEAFSNKGSVLAELNRFDDALRQLDKAITLDPENSTAWYNKGIVFQEMNRFNEALTHYDKAIQLKPDHFLAYIKKSHIKLLLGDLFEGWNLQEYRWKKIKYKYSEYPSLTSLGNISNKKILVWYEQGMGDTIQFSRFVLELVKLNAIVTLEVQKDLVILLQEQFNFLVTSEIKKNIQFDFQIPLLTLPKLLKININNIPKAKKFSINPNITLSHKKQLKISEKKLNIGISVSGNPKYILNKKRSMPIKYIEPLLNYGNFFLIQKSISSEDRIFLNENREISVVDKQINNFLDTAAIVENMDLIISIDTSLIHLAGSFYKKAFLLLSFSSDWRWQLDRYDTPWYSSVKIFRQKQINNWETVIHEVKKELEKIVN